MDTKSISIMYYQMIVTVAILVDVSMLVWKLDMCDTSISSTRGRTVLRQSSSVPWH